MNHGSVVTFRPVTQAAKDWVEENVHTEGWQWMGSVFAVDHRFVQDLIDGMVAAGLDVDCS